MVTAKPESLKVALQPRSARDRRSPAGATNELSDRVNQLAHELRVQLVRIGQLQAEVDLLRRKVG